MKNQCRALLIIVTIGIMLLSLNIVLAQMPQQGNSAVDQLRVLEIKMYNKSFDNEAIFARLQRLEMDVLGSPQTGALFERLGNLHNASASKPVQQQLIQPSNQNYGLSDNPGYAQNQQNYQPQQYQQPPVYNQKQIAPPANSINNNQHSTGSGDYNIPGLNSRFEPGIVNKNTLPTREELEKIKKQQKQDEDKTGSSSNANSQNIENKSENIVDEPVEDIDKENNKKNKKNKQKKK
ncbi:MAG: hypothetical protein AB1782_16895 [Cyanobacteriota bacterium]